MIVSLDMKSNHIVFILFIALLPMYSFAQMSAPISEYADILFENNELKIVFENKILLHAYVSSPREEYRWHTSDDESNGTITQIIAFSAKDWDHPVIMNGEITGSAESFPCEVDRRPKAPDIVRHSFGLSKSLLNRAVYDRKRDWVISFDVGSTIAIKPVTSQDISNKCSFDSKGFEVIIRFRPSYYQKHRGLKYFEPWTYSVWQKPVVGWCSWFAYYQDITEEKIKHVADVISGTLKPFGYEYLQIDDGYQRGQGLPELWLKPNEKFPSGLKNLSDYIQNTGIKPGIWTNVAFNQHEFAEQHKDWFVLDELGRPVSGNWIDLSIDGSNQMALDSIVIPVYKELKSEGWKYFKIDALRHLRYEGYNSNPEYFRRKNLDRVEVYRKLASTIRSEIGRDNYMLGCWGIRPELIGIIDGCRIGDDGFSYAGLAQYNSFNNIVWRNDPDHIELSEKEAYRSTMVTSLTGSVMLLTDKPDTYESARIEPAKRSAPTLFTLPGQIYDVDPSRSSLLDRVNGEISGSGPRPFDAGYIPKCELYLLEINKPYEHWMMLGRTGETIQKVNFSDLGLAADKEYYVFEFWSKKLIGSYIKELEFGKINSQFNCQLYCIRERKSVPQIVATNRHISCGGLELENVKWNDLTLSGESGLVANDTYDLYITEPDGYRFKAIACNNVDSTSNEKQGLLRVCHLKSAKGGKVQWEIRFER
jgi:alpha-galactosidase